MPRKKQPEPEWTPEKIAATVAAQLSASVRKPNNLMYKPHPKQLLYHASEKKGRQYIGGNRSGKTTGGINEDIWWLRGQHPFRKVPEPPVIGRLTTVDFKNGVNKIILPNLKQWIPPSLLINGSWEDSWNGQQHVLTLDNDSELEIMSYEQELEKFAGVPRHFTHFDEEPPKDIYQECMARLVDYNGAWWMTMTPVQGMTWTFEDIYTPALNGKNKLIDIIEVDIHENTYLSDEAITALLEGYDESQQEIRGAGKYIAVSGLIFKHYHPDIHIVPARIPPRTWTHYISLDAGFNNPTAVLWHAVSPEGLVVTYDEHYKAGLTIRQHADAIKAKEAMYRDRYGIVPFLRIADPAIRQRQQSTGVSVQIEYSTYGVNLALGSNPDVKAGLDKMNDYLRLNRWFISENCPNLQREMRMYRWAQYATAQLREKNNKKEEPLKKNDHACDSCRYFFSFMPDLNIQDLSKKPLVSRDQVAAILGGVTTFDVSRPYRIDEGLLRPVDPFRHVDEHVGEM